MDPAEHDELVAASDGSNPDEDVAVEERAFDTILRSKGINSSQRFTYAVFNLRYIRMTLDCGELLPSHRRRRCPAAPTAARSDGNRRPEPG